MYHVPTYIAKNPPRSLTRSKPPCGVRGERWSPEVCATLAIYRQLISKLNRNSWRLPSIHVPHHLNSKSNAAFCSVVCLFFSVFSTSHSSRMILRTSLARRFLVGAFLILSQLALLGTSAKDPTVSTTDFDHGPKKYFYFDDSSVRPVSPLL